MRDTTIAAREFKVERLDMISSLFALPPSDLALSSDEIHIWLADLDQSESQLHKLIQTLSVEERMRAEKYLFERDRKKYLLRRGILRTLLGSYLNVEPGRLQFQYGKYGKPVLADTFGKEMLHFNLSHSDELALFAFARHREIGVDIEHIGEISEMELIAERFFSRRENDSIRSLPEEQKKESFIKGWTCKEAFIKAVGDGLSRALDKFEVSMVPGEPAKLLSVEDDSREASRWSLQYLQPAPDYVGAFAVKSRMFKTKRWRWDVTLSGLSPSSIRR